MLRASVCGTLDLIIMTYERGDAHNFGCFLCAVRDRHRAASHVQYAQLLLVCPASSIDYEA